MNKVSDFSASAARRFASASVEVSGLSQMTWMPRFRNSRAAS
jgi:hypothetical protein